MEQEVQEGEVTYIPMTVNYDGIRDHGLRIIRDEVSSMTSRYHRLKLSDVQGLLCGISLALQAVPITQETLVVRDAVKVALEKVADRVRDIERKEENDVDD